MSLLVTGYPYVRESFSKTFLNYHSEVFFLLPSAWKIKGGKVTYRPLKKNNVFTTKTLFYHSNYPIVGGVLKGWMPLFPLHLLKLSKKIKIVYTATEPVLLSTLYNGFWSKIMGKKHVIFTWENIPLESKLKGLKGTIQKTILKLNLAFCDGIICGNKKAESIFKSYTNKPISVIPLSGVDTDFFTPAYNVHNGINFAFVGSISYRKGIHNLLNVFKGIKNEFDTKLFLVGSGEYEKEIDEIIDKLDLKDNVSRVPWVDHEKLKELLNNCDIFLYPSISHGGWEEQFGYSIAEASLMELPIISTRSGSIEDVVIDGQTGILVEPENEIQLKDAMLKLAKDNELRKKMGLNGREFISSNYSYQIIADKLHNFFTSL